MEHSRTSDWVLSHGSRSRRAPNRTPANNRRPRPAPRPAPARRPPPSQREAPRRESLPPRRSGNGNGLLGALAVAGIAVAGVGYIGIDRANDNPVCPPDAQLFDNIECGYFGNDNVAEALPPTFVVPGQTTLAPATPNTPAVTVAPGVTATTLAPATIAPTTAAPRAAETPSANADLAGIAGLNGYSIPCEGAPRAVRRINSLYPHADWSGIPTSGTIGEGSSGDPINVYIREACDIEDTRTLVVIASIHGGENGGQFVGHELLFNADIPDNWRVIVVPELNRSAIELEQRRNGHGVDLNRNSPFGWEDTSSGRTNPSGNFYRGPSSASEPETQALISFLSELGRVDLALYYHDLLGYAATVGNTPAHLAITYATQAGLKVGKYGNPDNPNVTVNGAPDAWHNHTTGSPALLIEMLDDQSDSVIQRHVGAVVSTMNYIG